MAEYQKLNSEDSGLYGISKFLNQNIPFCKKSSFLSKFQKSIESDKLELVDFGNNNDLQNSYVNKYNSLSLSIYNAIHIL